MYLKFVTYNMKTFYFCSMFFNMKQIITGKRYLIKRLELKHFHDEFELSYYKAFIKKRYCKTIEIKY